MHAAYRRKSFLGEAAQASCFMLGPSDRTKRHGVHLLDSAFESPDWQVPVLFYKMLCFNAEHVQG